jgi:formylglycine-generating enzyme required for sulfatase activity
MDKKVFGDYTIIKQIGQGCLGTVYLAEHRFIKKHYALKVLSEELSSDKAFVQRFEKEMTLLASLDHPHIVKIHNVSFADGYYFVVMDCIVDAYGETTNLGEYLRVHQCKMQEGEFASILSQVASALDYAHQKKIGDQYLIHRGLKLNNILVGKKEGGIHLYISDFGLSHILGEGAILTKNYKVLADMLSIDPQHPASMQDASKLSKLQASFLQSYHFLAPEQKELSAKHLLTPKVDTYAFGILTYYLLTRKYPEGIFPMPSKLGVHFQLDWDALLNKCLQYNPNMRAPYLMEALGCLTPSTKVKPFQEKPPAPSPMPASTPYFSMNVQETKECRAPEPIYTSTAVLETPYEEEDVFSAVSVKKELKPILKPTEIKRPMYEEDPSTIFQLESTVARYIPKEKEISVIEPILTEMVVIPGGEYYRGSNTGGRDERPKHLVRLNSFALDIHPVTNDQFVRFLEAMGGEKDANNNDIIRLRECRIKRLGGKLVIESGYAKHPVAGVSWYGATAYAKWIGKRLPTEAEWEIAATSGLPDMIYPTGMNIERTQANFFSADTVNVMSYPCNQFGLYDMAGNVYEWCQDWYDYSYYEQSLQEPEDPQGPLQGVYRVLRGGCWKSLQDDLRCTHRHRNNPGTINRTYGFRCAADVK